MMEEMPAGALRFEKVCRRQFREILKKRESALSPILPGTVRSIRFAVLEKCRAGCYKTLKRV